MRSPNPRFSIGPWRRLAAMLALVLVATGCEWGTISSSEFELKYGVGPGDVRDVTLVDNLTDAGGRDLAKRIRKELGEGPIKLYTLSISHHRGSFVAEEKNSGKPALYFIGEKKIGLMGPSRTTDKQDDFVMLRHVPLNTVTDIIERAAARSKLVDARLGGLRFEPPAHDRNKILVKVEFNKDGESETVTVQSR
jgi:hypothetical protein